LWDRKEHHPPSDPRLELAFSPRRQDILVRYEECLNYSTNSQRRTYWLFASTNAAATRSRPEFIQEPDTNGLQTVPIFVTDEERKKAAPTGYWAKRKTAFGYGGFVLWRDNQRIQAFMLPDYSDWGHANAWRVALTPLSASGDVVLNVSLVAVAVPVEVAYVVVHALVVQGQTGQLNGVNLWP